MHVDPALESKLIEESSIAAFHMAWEIVKEAKHAVWNEVEIRRAMSNYAQKYSERHGMIKILGMSEPVPLREVYTAVQTMRPDFLRKFTSVEEMEAAFVNSKERGFARNVDKSDAMDAANRIQFLNILGQPGAGKSTFLRRLGLEALLPRKSWFGNSLEMIKSTVTFDSSTTVWSEYKHENLPVLIELRRMRDGKLDILQLIEEEFDTCGFPDPSRFIERALGRGKLLILLDGLDEVPGSCLEAAIINIRDFVDKYGRSSDAIGREELSLERERDKEKEEKKKRPVTLNRFITSCRTAFYTSFFHRFTDVLLADYDKKQINQFIKNWFQRQQDRETGVAAKFIETLRLPIHRATLELARTPLLLTFLCLVYDSTQRLPANRSALYKRGIDILIERWAAEKRIHNNPIYQDLHPEFEVQMLAEIAGPAYISSKFFFSEKDLVGKLRKFLQNELQAPKHLDASHVLDAIEIQQGIIVKRAEDVYSFSHLTVQEYLTAVYFVEAGLVNELVEKHLFEERWQEVFLLVSGMLSKSDELLQWMMDLIEAFLSRCERVERLIQWSNACVSHASEVVEAKVMQMSAILYALSRELTLETGSAFDVTLARLRNVLQQTRAYLLSENAKDLFKPAMLGRKLDQLEGELRVRTWDRAELEHFIKYLQACSLLMECRLASLRVDKAIWEGIQKRVF
ncbi:MAG TPA: hypothetical protein VHY22_05385 [Chthoniobacteraceae bacterium]|nr:hypothetical protein [Chthoniobacteraceae bacterium]